MVIRENPMEVGFLKKTMNAAITNATERREVFTNSTMAIRLPSLSKLARPT